MLEVKTSKLPTLPLKTIWMLSFGYLGVQMAFSLQSSNMGRILKHLVRIQLVWGSSSFYHHWQEFLFNQ